jgi:hypothetical protein
VQSIDPVRLLQAASVREDEGRSYNIAGVVGVGAAGPVGVVAEPLLGFQHQTRA